MPIPAAALQIALREACRDDPVTVHRVETADRSVRLVFRYRADSVRYAVDLPDAWTRDGTIADGRIPDTSIDDAGVWATAVRSRLVAALDDGWLSRARRTRTGAGVTLSVTECATVVPPGYALGDVAVRSPEGRLADVGWWLATEGFTVAPVQRAAALGQVASWVAGSAATELAAPTLAHAAVVAGDDRAGLLLVVETRPRVPPSLGTACVYRALRSAAEAGIDSVGTTLDVPALAPLGLRAIGGRAVRILLADLPVPDLAV